MDEWHGNEDILVRTEDILQPIRVPKLSRHFVGQNAEIS